MEELDNDKNKPALALAGPRQGQVLAFFEGLTGKEPDLNGMLFLLGVNALGQGQRTFSKEEKQDLMHLGICTVLAPKGHWILTHSDRDGWPHYELGTPMPLLALEEQEAYLSAAIADYLEAEGLL